MRSWSQTQVLMHGRQALYQVNCIPDSLFQSCALCPSSSLRNTSQGSANTPHPPGLPGNKDSSYKLCLLGWGHLKAGLDIWGEVGTLLLLFCCNSGVETVPTGSRKQLRDSEMVRGEGLLPKGRSSGEPDAKKQNPGSHDTLQQAGNPPRWLPSPSPLLPLLC